MRTSNRLRDVILLVLLGSATQGIDLPTVSHSDHRGPQHAIETGTCEARIAHHVTRTRPSLCSTDAPEGNTTIGSPPSYTQNSSLPITAETAPAPINGDGASLADAAGPPFMSFEDWKEEMLKRTGQDPHELRSRKANDPQRAGDRSLSDDSGTTWGDEEEIALDFGEYAQPEAKNHNRGEEASEQKMEEYTHDAAIAHDSGKGFPHRSKDAGKTCKERFSYSSFDAGATILKTGSGTKNPKAILVENKDSYMLLECGRENKFIIIELSDDILLDTVVIANFEFFSSMIRHFRISVSDRYPVKVDKWKDLGTFEARNSRDIQAFLVENPQIWARYVRIEFLTHYGNEYYCPVSLIRIHGTRMLDSWKEADGPPGEDLAEEDDREARQCEDTRAEISATSVSETASTHHSQTNSPNPPTPEYVMTSMDLFAIFAATCPALPTQLLLSEDGEPVQNVTRTNLAEVTTSSQHSSITEVEPVVTRGNITIPEQTVPTSRSPAQSSSSNCGIDNVRKVANTSIPVDRSSADQKPQTENPSTKNAQVSQGSKQSQSGSPGARSRGTPTSNTAAASPTVQEGFFNSITKRLIQVESNLTLSMKYIEDQSRHVQEAMQRMEQKQSQRITLALDVLNSTVFAELRTMHGQYEQLVETTLQTLQSQRERTEQDAIALSARLNLLADEVVFQKRMAIAQAVLLLSCLFLVIFSRGVPLPSLAHSHQNEEPSLASLSRHTTASLRRGSAVPGSIVAQCSPTARMMTPESTADTDQVDDAHFETEDPSSQVKTEPQYRDALSRYYQPSTPATSRSQLDGDRLYHEILTEAPSARLPASDQHKSRKPLPALPEHPLSP